MKFNVLFCLLLLSTPSYSQKFKSVKFQTGTGVTHAIDYQPIFNILEYSEALGETKKKVFFTWYVQHQLNLIRDSKDFEGGVNFGLKNNIRFSNKFILYQMAGLGPHYISAEMDRQAKGFIFSDNAAIGTYLKAGSLMLNLQAGFRHLSNASLARPNRGINTFNFLIGLTKIYFTSNYNRS